MDPIHALSELFAKFPGIGTRQAKRFVYFLLDTKHEYRTALVQQIKELERAIKICPSCYVHFAASEKKLCDVCARNNVDESVLLVVEKDSDYESFNKSKIHLGRFFVFGGHVPAVEKDVEEFTRIKELKGSILERVRSGLKEVILAFPVTAQGEHTESFIRKYLFAVTEEHGITITSLGRGLSTGSEPEYADSETLRNAFQGRKIRT